MKQRATPIGQYQNSISLRLGEGRAFFVVKYRSGLLLRDHIWPNLKLSLFVPDELKFNWAGRLLNREFAKSTSGKKLMRCLSWIQTTGYMQFRHSKLLKDKLRSNVPKFKSNLHNFNGIGEKDNMTLSLKHFHLPAMSFGTIVFALIAIIVEHLRHRKIDSLKFFRSRSKIRPVHIRFPNPLKYLNWRKFFKSNHE